MRRAHLKRPWCWEGLRMGREGDDREWDGWMASLTQWRWVSVDSGSWWWTGRLGVLWSMGSQRVGQDWATELNWTELVLNLVQKALSTIFHVLQNCLSLQVFWIAQKLWENGRLKVNWRGSQIWGHKCRVQGPFTHNIFIGYCDTHLYGLELTYPMW